MSDMPPASPGTQKRKFNTTTRQVVVTIGDNLKSFPLPLLYLLLLHHYSHIIHPPHTPSNLRSLSYLWEETKTLLNTSAEVSNSECPLWSHTSPRWTIFILPVRRLFSAPLTTSPGLLHQLLPSLTRWTYLKMAWWR